MDQMKLRYQQQFAINYGSMGGIQIKPWIHEHYPTKLHKKSNNEFEWYLVQGIRAHSDSIWVAKFSPDG